MLSCRQVAEKLSENIDKPLTGSTWLKVQFHLFICRICRLYGEQIEITDDTIKSVDAEAVPNEEVREKVESNYRELHVKKNKS